MAFGPSRMKRTLRRRRVGLRLQMGILIAQHDSTCQMETEQSVSSTLSWYVETNLHCFWYSGVAGWSLNRNLRSYINMGYDFRLAKNNEIDTIFSLYKKRIQWMDKSGIQQWNMTNYLEVYPISYYADRQRLGELYVLSKEDVVIGAVVLLQSDECWPQMADSPAYYVHNLVTELSVKGAGKIILSEVEKMAISKGIQFLRLDCAVDNKFLNEYYESMGYKMVGCCKEGAYIGNKREKELH